jgi:(p)ppGpp synthase/HD superfamily hydrolase
MHVVKKAIQFATDYHSGQKRKYSGEEYISHPKEVMEILLRGLPHVTDEILAAAVLHDVLEDTAISLERLQAEFGFVIASYVQELTEPKSDFPRWKRKRDEARRLGNTSWEAQTIKYADIISNMKDIWQKDPEFAPKYALEKRWAISEMNKGYAPLRQTAWLATFPPKETD